MFKQFQLDVNKTYEQVDLTEHQQTEEAFVNQEPIGKTGGNTLTAEDFVKLFGALKVMADREKDELIRLDSVAGDGDMGLSMADGFAAVQHYLEGKTFSDIGELFYRVGKKMQASAASSMGTLVAFGFMGVGKAFRGRTEIRCQELGDLLAAFEQAIMKLGGAKPGDKTFLDGLHPAVEVLKSATTDDEARALLPRAAQAAKEGSDKTTTMVARFGRIAFRGEASRSILDPGSVLAAFIVRTLAESI
jgi:dihydroxyacetone kinase-like protein